MNEFQKQILVIVDRSGCLRESFVDNHRVPSRVLLILGKNDSVRLQDIFTAIVVLRSQFCSAIYFYAKSFATPTDRHSTWPLFNGKGCPLISWTAMLVANSTVLPAQSSYSHAIGLFCFSAFRCVETGKRLKQHIFIRLKGRNKV